MKSCGSTGSIWIPPRREYDGEQQTAPQPLVRRRLLPRGVTPTARYADSLDWKGIPASEISQRVLTRVRPGSIILFHNAGEHTPEALPQILETLLSQGYKIVPISALVIKGAYNVDYTIDHTGRQIARTGTEPAGSGANSANKKEEARTPGTGSAVQKETAPKAEEKAAQSGAQETEIKPEQPQLQKPAASKKK